MKRFEKTLTRYFTRKLGFEAVLRIRTSRGLALTGFYGNFFVRSPDLLALANVNPDSALAAQVTIEEKLAGYVCFQSALLYTSSKGDRRIRVHTMCLPTTGDLLQLYNNFDLKATVSYLAKIGVERSMTGSALADSREALVNAVVDSVGAYQKAVSRGSGMLVPRSGHLRLFPSYVLALLKHVSYLIPNLKSHCDFFSSRRSLLLVEYVSTTVPAQCWCFGSVHWIKFWLTSTHVSIDSTSSQRCLKISIHRSFRCRSSTYPGTASTWWLPEQSHSSISPRVLILRSWSMCLELLFTMTLRR